MKGPNEKKHTYGILSAERIERLERIGFKWRRIFEEQKSRSRSKYHSWERGFAALKAWKKEHGQDHAHGHDAQWCGKNKNGVNLGKWVLRQRWKYAYATRNPVEIHKNYPPHTAEQIERLNSIGFHWTWYALKISWEKYFAALEAWKKENGQGRDPPSKLIIPRGEGGGHHKLGKWCSRQRQKYINTMRSPNERKPTGTLRAEQIERLEHIGFQWEVTTGSSSSGQCHKRKRQSCSTAQQHCTMYKNDTRSIAL